MLLGPAPHNHLGIVVCVVMTPHSPTPDWAESCMKRITKYDDPELLDTVLEFVLGLTGLNDKDRNNPSHLALRDDAARAALDFGYRLTQDCEQRCEEYLGIAV